MHRFQIVSWILAIIYFSNSSEAFRLGPKYDVIDASGPSCETLDACEYRRSTNSTPSTTTANDYTCSCDLQCSEYDDCCIDGPKYLSSKNQMNCLEVKDLGGAYMIDSCPSEYEGPDSVQELCQSINLGYQEDPMAAMPVTDVQSGITYKNYYCSMCNEKSDGLIMWTPKLECPLLPLYNQSGKFTEEYIHKNLELQDGYWGLFIEEGGSPFFYDCEVTPVMPTHLLDIIRRCVPNLVSDCPSSWKDENVRSLCKSYTGHRFDHKEGNRYRNVHCAICNGVNVEQLSCQSLEEIDFFRSSGSFSFAHLMDVNEGKGQMVGKVSLCRKSEVYDRFHRRCREVMCIPGFELRGTKCQPIARKVIRHIPASKIFKKIKKSDVHASFFNVASKAMKSTSQELQTQVYNVTETATRASTSTVMKSNEIKSTSQGQQTQVYNVTESATHVSTSTVFNATSVPANSSEFETTSLGTAQNISQETQTTTILEDRATTSVEDLIRTEENTETTRSYYDFDNDQEISDLLKKLFIHF